MRLIVLCGRSKLYRTIEVDEVLVGCKTLEKRGRGAEGKSLKSFIERNIESSSTIITDGWPSYSKLDRMGYMHKIQKTVAKEEDEEILQTIV